MAAHIGAATPMTVKKQFLNGENVGDAQLTSNGSNEDTFGLCQDVNPACTCPRWNRERPSAAAETKVMTR